MAYFIQKIKSFPKEYQDILYSDVLLEETENFLEKINLPENAAENLSNLAKSVYVKELSLDNFILEAKKILTEKQSEKIIIEFLAKFFLAVDNFIGIDVLQKIQELGGDVKKYQDYKKDILQKLDKELHPPEEKPPVIIEEEEIEPEEEEAGPPDIEKDKKEYRGIFKEALLLLIQSEDQALKMGINDKILDILFEDPPFQLDLLRDLINNTETITEKITVEGKDVPGSINNWILDFVSVIGAGKIDNLAIGRYFAESKNISALKPEEKVLLRRVLDLYKMIKEFPDPLEKVPVEEWYIFPIDYDLLRKQVEQDLIKEGVIKPGQKTKEAPVQPAEQKQETDIRKIYLGDEMFSQKVQDEKNKITEKTRNEYNRVGDEMENYLLKRDKVGVIASLRIMAEIGVLPSILRLDKRYMNLLYNYYRKINRLSEADSLRLSPKTPHHVVNFLKYVLMVRLELGEQDSARISAHLANTLARAGQPEYADMAYLDMRDRLFHWKS